MAQRGTDDDRYYFEPATATGDAWTARISSFTTPFQLWLVALADEWGGHLSTVTPEAGHTWWSSPELPPGAVVIHDTQVSLTGDVPDRCPE